MTAQIDGRMSSEGPVVEWLRTVAENSDAGWIVACVMAILNAVIYLDKRLYQRYRDRLADAAEWSDEQEAWNQKLKDKIDDLEGTVSELREKIEDQQESIDRLCRFIDDHDDVETPSDEIIS